MTVISFIATCLLKILFPHLTCAILHLGRFLRRQSEKNLLRNNMKRGTKCIAQTINLSKPNTCVRPKIQRLVSADADFCSDSDRASSYCGPKPVAVKVCSREDVQRKCRPKVRILSDFLEES